jgi:GDPmannose 4,6-dehydratase
MFGKARRTPQNEDTPFQPRSLYGLAKLTGFHSVGLYRRRHGVFACTAILFNHESPRRSPLFLPRKVALAAARIKLGKQQRLTLGNLEASRDWGYAPDYVEAMWLMLQQPKPQDFVISTGQTHRVREVVEMAFDSIALDYRAFVDVDAKFVRPTEGVPLCGDYRRLAAATGWRPRKALKDVVSEMVAYDLSAQSALADSSYP